MNQEQKRIKLAEADGWKRIAFYDDGMSYYQNAKGERASFPASQDGVLLPDYFNDLNAVHELEKLITYHQSHAYMQNLHETMSPGTKVGDVQLTCDMFPFVSASAARKAEAIGKTLNLW